MALGGTHTSTKAQQSPCVQTNRYHPPRYEFFSIKIHSLFPEELTKNQKGALYHSVKIREKLKRIRICTES